MTEEEKKDRDTRAAEISAGLDDLERRHQQTRALLGMNGGRDENDLALAGQDLLDALTLAHHEGHYKGWTFTEVSRSASVMPMAVYEDRDPSEPITKHEAIIMKGNDSMTMMITTRDGVMYQDYVAAGPPTKSM